MEISEPGWIAVKRLMNVYGCEVNKSNIFLLLPICYQIHFVAHPLLR